MLFVADRPTVVVSSSRLSLTFFHQHIDGSPESPAKVKSEDLDRSLVAGIGHESGPLLS